MANNSRYRDQLESLYGISAQIASLRDLTEVYDLALTFCLALTASEMGFIDLLNEGRSTPAAPLQHHGRFKIVKAGWVASRDGMSRCDLVWRSRANETKLRYDKGSSCRSASSLELRRGPVGHCCC